LRSCGPIGRSAGGTGKTDVVDAIAAARAVLSGEADATPKTHDGPVEALRTLKVAQRSASKARTQAPNRLRALLVTAPDELRARVRDLTRRELLHTCAGFRISSDDDPLAAITRFGMRELAQRVLHLDGRLSDVKARLKRITERAAPDLVALTGVGPDVASTLLLAAGEDPERLVSERSFASLCGASPVQASSGKTHRHRLNRGGDRQANAALWRITLVRLHCDPRTKDYLTKRVKDGKSKTEAIRCLKRYIAREVFAALPISAAA
jgi:transposase